jgi:hypothetical protein
VANAGEIGACVGHGIGDGRSCTKESPWLLEEVGIMQPKSQTTYVL